MGLFGLSATENNAGRFLDNAFDKKALQKIAKPESPDLALKRKKGKVVVRFIPSLGLHDLQVRKGKKWKNVLNDSGAAKANVRIGKAKRIRLRGRSVSAAGVASDWQKASAKL